MGKNINSLCDLSIIPNLQIFINTCASSLLVRVQYLVPSMHIYRYIHIYTYDEITVLYVVNELNQVIPFEI